MALDFVQRPEVSDASKTSSEVFACFVETKKGRGEMAKPTGPENLELKSLIEELRKSGSKEYLALAKYLSKPRRSKREVDISKINEAAKEHEKIVVPAKVLGNGVISKPVTVYAWQFSKQAKEKITKAGGKSLNLNDFVKEKAAARMIV